MTGQPIELLLTLRRDAPRTLRRQIEDQLRAAIRTGILRPGAPVPSTRDLAQQLGVSRPVVVEAYVQLAAEGYLSLHQGARPRVSDAAAPSAGPPAVVDRSHPKPRFDFRPNVPDLSAFPRTAWLRSLRQALSAMTDADLDYGDPAGAAVLRSALADYLRRVRGVVADPAQVVVTSGYAQARSLVCRALLAAGARRIGIEDPSHPEQRAALTDAGLQLEPIGVDESGINVDELARAGVDAVVLTPAHQFPSGVVLSGARRTALLAWLRQTNAVAIEDDYDAEYRYDRDPVGALQGRAPDRVVYMGTASKTLAPVLRLGWLVAPEVLLDGVRHAKRLADLGGPGIDQHAFADFLTRGELDRHLRRMRIRYAARRDALIAALAKTLSDATVRGIAAGLHAAVELPAGHDERAILDAARLRQVAFTIMSDYRIRPTDGPPTLLLGYAQSNERTIRDGVLQIAAAIAAVDAY